MMTLSPAKKVMMRTLMPHEMMGMLPFTSMSDKEFKVLIMMRTSNDWMLYADCKENSYEKHGSIKIVSEDEFNIAKAHYKKPLLTYNLYKEMMVKEEEWKAMDEEDPANGTESEHYCDEHQDEVLLHDGKGGHYCEVCDEEDGVVS